MALQSMTKAELEEFIKSMKNHRGRATELISVYIPSGYDVNAVQRQLEAEKSTAKNIKSTATRKNVSDSLDRIVRLLKDYKVTPEKGMALFAGNVSENEGETDIQSWEIEPPEEVRVRLYRCDKEFVLEPLESMTEVSEIYALLVMDRKEATIGQLFGKRIETLQKMTSGVPSKVRAGGQCLSPDSWVGLNKVNKDMGNLKIEDKIRALDIKRGKIVFTKVKSKCQTVKDKLLEIFVEDGESIKSSLDHTFFIKNERGIQEVIAENLKVGDILLCTNNYDLLELKIINIQEQKGNFNLVDIETEEENFFANGFLVHNSSQRFHRITEGLTKEFYKRIAEEMKNLFYEEDKLKGILIGGPIPTKNEFVDGEYLPKKLQDKIIGIKDQGDTSASGLQELVNLSQDVLAKQEIIHEKKILERFFNSLGKDPKMTPYKYEDVKKALQYGAVDTLIVSKDFERVKSNELKKLAEQMGTAIEIVSGETDEGKQFLNLGGIGAIQRFGI